MFRKRKSRLPISWEAADDVKKEVLALTSKLGIYWIKNEHVHCVRSQNSKARAYARIWGMGRIWQETLGIPASYCIEVISEKYDPLPKHKKTEVLIHEIAHIPKNFSGALVPHSHGRGGFHDKLKVFIDQYKRR